VTKAQLAALWGLALGIVLVFAALTYVLSRPQSSPALLSAVTPVSVQAAVESPTVESPVVDYRLSGTPYSARSLYSQAEQEAQAWQPDARLVSATASWPFSDLDGLSAEVDWTFSFYSPGTQRICVLDVNPDRVLRIRETLSPYPLPIVAPEQWQIDSYQALNAWLNGGGGAFMREQPIVDVSMRLGSEDGRVVWTITGAANRSEAAFTMTVDALNGGVRE
jgi:hypothetical protein